MQGILYYLSIPSFNTNFPNIEIVLIIIIYMPYSNVNEEGIFSVLRRVKNYLCLSLANEKLSALTILCIEDDVVKYINWTKLRGTSRK